MSGLLLLAALLCGLIAMHGLQPTTGPLPAASVLAPPAVQAGDRAMPMAGTHGRHGDAPGFPHQEHGGGEVCLTFLPGGPVLPLLLVIAGAGGLLTAPIRPLAQPFPPRGPTARPRGPTRAQLCVIRV
ncbi:DUF6153 family protein [Sphaerisporangium rufum]|uniref:DUF6153 family protein n=1 Tax=Sphaerisporangium rufum TaxID=1381558 RepID=UPI00194E5089|nr:DUF6153 family protein [Sphaerisporangium rufum]